MSNVIDIYDCGHHSLPYDFNDYMHNERLKMIPFRRVCNRCHKIINVIEIKYELQYYRSLKINKILENVRTPVI